MAKQERLKKIIRREMENCIGLSGGQLSRERESLKDAYYGNAYPVDAARAERGFSTYVDRTVLETVEWAKGPLLKVFAGSDELVRFEPGSPQDEQFAADATDYVNKIVFGRHAFDLVYGPLTDGLYQRVGWAKAYVDQDEVRTIVQEMDELDQEQAEAVAAMVEMDPDLESEVSQDKESGLYAVQVIRVQRNEQIRILPLPSERVIYSKDAISIEDARFIAHWEDRMLGELLAEGYSREVLEKIGSDEDDYPETKAQRMVNSEDAGTDGQNRGDGSRLIRVYEAYVHADVSGKGDMQRLKVTFAGSADHFEILEQEDWTMYRPPLFAACSLPLPYSPVGLSIADLVVDVQKLRTEMFRDVLDNMYLSNHGEMHVKKGNSAAKVNLDQLLNRQAGGFYETEGDVELVPLPVTNISVAALQGLELTDKTKEQRTGIGMTMQGLSADALQNTASGAIIQEEAQNVRLELIARVYAETFFKPMARYVLALAVKYIKNPVMLQRKGSFAEIQPSQWDPDMDVTVAVGLGTGSRHKQAGAWQGIMLYQAELIKGLGKQSPVRLTHLIKAAHKWVEAQGLEAPEQYFGTVEDAAKAEEAIMNQPSQPSPEEKKLQMQAQMEQQKMQFKQQESAQKLHLEQSKAEADLQNDAARIRAELMLQAQKMEQEGRLSEYKMALEAMLDSIKLRTSLPSAGATVVKGQGAL